MEPAQYAGAEAPLAVHLERLRRFLQPLGLRYERIVLVDEPLPGEETSFDAAPEPPEAFEPTWQSVVRAGARDWVNLTAVGLRGDELLVAVEHWREPLDGRRLRPDQMRVNLSGPRRG